MRLSLAQSRDDFDDYFRWDCVDDFLGQIRDGMRLLNVRSDYIKKI